MTAPPAHEVEKFDYVTLIDRGELEGRSIENLSIQLHGDIQTLRNIQFLKQ